MTLRSAGLGICAIPPGSQSHRADHTTPPVARVLFFDAFPKRVAHEPGDPDRGTGLSFGLLERLSHRLAGIMDEGLIDQADLLVKRLHSRLDHLTDHGVRLAPHAAFIARDVL